MPQPCHRAEDRLRDRFRRTDGTRSRRPRAREFAGKRLRHHELKELGLKHALFIADIYMKLVLLTRNSPVSMVGWVEDDPSLSDSVNTFDANGPEIANAGVAGHLVYAEAHGVPRGEE
jgi:hypothetical protein